MTRLRPLIAIPFLALLALLQAGPSLAWSSDPTVNSPVCLDPAYQSWPVSCPDGSGGVYVVWEKGAPDVDLYAQHLDADGNRLWTPLDGVVVCNYAGDQLGPLVSADGDSGFYCVWKDRRATWYGIHAQRFDADGNALWQPNGVPVVVGVDTHPTDILTIPVGSPDDPGGMATVWNDDRDEYQGDIYWQWLDRDGVNRLSSNGNPVCIAPDEQNDARLAMIGEGGGLVVWTDKRDPDDWLLYAQLLAGDPPVPQWDPAGVLVSTLNWTWNDFDVVTNVDETAIIAWRTATAYGDDIAIQRIDAAGNLLWGPAGTTVTDEPLDQGMVRAVPDGAGGAIIVWKEWDGTAANGIYGQRLSPGGYRLWDPVGVQILSLLHGEHVVAPCPGGAIIAWTDYRGAAAPDPTGWDIYAQRIDNDGVVQWPVDGVAVSTAHENQEEPTICPDGRGGAIVAWTDFRALYPDPNIYAQQISHSGVLGSVTAVPREEPGPVTRLRALPAQPNPFTDATMIAWEQPAVGDARIEIFDLAGHRVAHHVERGLPAGRWAFRFEARAADGRPLPGGVYVFRVSIGREQATGKVILTR